MKVVRTARISLVTLGLLAGCSSNQDRSNTNSQDNPSLQGGTAVATGTSTKELETTRAERDRLKAQVAESNKAAEELRGKLSEVTAQNEAAQARLKSIGDELAKANADLEAAKKNQGDADQVNARLKAAEDGVTAARAKTAEADRAAAAAVEAANKAKEQAAQLATERAALQEKVNALQAEIVRKSAATPPAVPDLNK